VPAVKQIFHVEKWWRERKTQEAFPDIIFRDMTLDKGWFQTENLPRLFAYTWTILIGLLIAAAIMHVYYA
jgi:hypothetical protein